MIGIVIASMGIIFVLLSFNPLAIIGLGLWMLGIWCETREKKRS